MESGMDMRADAFATKTLTRVTTPGLSQLPQGAPLANGFLGLDTTCSPQVGSKELRLTCQTFVRSRVCDCQPLT